jgi:microcystin-dependent protein
MATPFIGEIRMFGGNFAIQGWAFCDGSLLAISEYDTLFNLIGTTYGGDGQETFALPDLRGRAPVHMGQSAGTSSFVLGQQAGTESVTLTTQQIPAHTHVPQASTNGGSDSPSGNVWGNSATGKPYGPVPTNAALNAASVQSSGGSQPHDNMQPYLVVNYIISLFGIYPSQN